MNYQTALHPSTKQSFILNLKANEPYGTADITAADFSGSSTITFNTNGTLSAGGTVTLQLGGRQKQVVVNGVSGDVTIN